jgi:hypothetical protein
MRKLRAATTRLKEDAARWTNPPAREPHRHPAGIVRMPRWLRSVQVAGFSRKRRLVITRIREKTGCSSLTVQQRQPNPGRS